MKRPLPALPEPFPAGFRAVLDHLLRHDVGLLRAREEAVRARYRALRQTGTFAGHRPYVPGDDLRRLDWNAVARTGSLFVKLLEEDERRASTLLLDTSPSMLAGQVPRQVHALRLAAILGALSLAHLDGVHVRAGGSTVVFERRGAVPRLLAHLESLPVHDEPPLSAALQLLRDGAPGAVHWISDFTAPATAERVLGVLRRGGSRVNGWLCQIDDDLGELPHGWLMVHDPETGDEMPVQVDRDLASAVAAQLALLRRQQDTVFRAADCPLQRLRLPLSDFSVNRWLEAGWSFRR